MKIYKTATVTDRFKNEVYYYNSAREGMFDLLNNMYKEGFVNTIFLPGYIGWSSKEGSGIFDPINKLEGLTVEYYKMTSDLDIDFDDLVHKMKNLEEQKFAVLIVNYFGFIDPRIEELTHEIKKQTGWIIEDNAHGFFTHLYSNHPSADATFFSLHKMFPFAEGGSLKILNGQLREFEFQGKGLYESRYNPWMYDISRIAFMRKFNYKKLDKIIKQEQYNSLFDPLRYDLCEGSIPQTYPIKIKVGNRDKIYEMMNDSGYGVVSLYHTLIEPLRDVEHDDAYKLSKQILNLPIHQDTDSNLYESMVELLSRFCTETI